MLKSVHMEVPLPTYLHNNRIIQLFQLAVGSNREKVLDVFDARNGGIQAPFDDTLPHSLQALELPLVHRAVDSARVNVVVVI